MVDEEAAPEHSVTIEVPGPDGQMLRRDVLMRVQTDDEEDPCLVEQLVTV